MKPEDLLNAAFGLTFDDLRAANVERCRASFPMCASWTTADWMMALVGEVGQLANLLKKERRGDFDHGKNGGYDNFRREVAKELADVQTYLDLLADYAGVDLGAATISKFNEVSDRVGSDIKL